MFRRKPLNERVAKAVIDLLKRGNSLGPNTIGPEAVTGWSATIDADGRVDIHLTLQHPNRSTYNRVEVEPLDA